MKFRKVTSKLVLLSALVAIGCYIYLLFLSWWYHPGHEPAHDALARALFFPAVIVCLLSSAVAAFTYGISKKCPRIRVVAMVLGVLGGVVIAGSMGIVLAGYLGAIMGVTP